MTRTLLAALLAALLLAALSVYAGRQARLDVALVARDEAATRAVCAPWVFAWATSNVEGWLPSGRNGDLQCVNGVPAGWCVEWRRTTNGLPAAVFVQPGGVCDGWRIEAGRYVFDRR